MRLAIGIVLLAAGAWAHDPVTTKITWAREISRLVNRRCAGCHAEGGAAFSLATYAAARPWAVAIKESVLTRQMPPWPAAKGFGSWAGDLSLSQEEISLLAEWVEGGAPEGDPALLPAAKAAARPEPGTRPAGREMTLRPGMVLAAPVTLRAVRVEAAGRLWCGATPIVWGLRADPRWLRLQTPVTLPAGARIEGTGRAAVILAAP